MIKVCITGIGILAANGNSKDAYWESLVAGRSGIAPVTLFDASALTSRIAGEVKNFEPKEYSLAPSNVGREARNTQLSLAAASLALEDGKLTPAQLRGRVPVLIAMGVSTSSVDIIEAAIRRNVKRGTENATPHMLTTSGIQMPANLIAANLGVPCETHTLSSACAAGQDAIAFAANAIRTGRVDIAIAGGADAPLSPALFGGFCASKMVSLRNNDPARASCPFDLTRDGGVVAEGAAVVILESLSHARSRGVVPYAEIASSSVRTDVRGDVHGAGLLQSMRMALADAGCLPSEIDYICAHGPSDQDLDRNETEAIKSLFGKHAYRLSVSSVKGVTGNPLAAAGSIQIATAALAIRHQLVPMTANYRYRDPLCDLDYVGEASRHQRVNHVLVNNHGITGGNSSTVVRRTDLT